MNADTLISLLFNSLLMFLSQQCSTFIWKQGTAYENRFQHDPDINRFKLC